MSKNISAATPELNRLRAASALIPIIESGVADSKLSIERASLMASFCEWVVNRDPQGAEEVKLAEAVVDGLARLRTTLRTQI
jgi:hypothetical protein